MILLLDVERLRFLSGAERVGLLRDEVLDAIAGDVAAKRNAVVLRADDRIPPV